MVTQIRAAIFLITALYSDLGGKASVIVDDECDHSTVASPISLLRDSSTVATLLSSLKVAAGDAAYLGFTATSAAPKLINRAKYAQAGIKIAPDGYWLLELPPSVTTYVGLRKLFGSQMHSAIEIVLPEEFPGFVPPSEVVLCF